MTRFNAAVSDLRRARCASLAVAVAATLTLSAGLLAPASLHAQRQSAIPQDPSRLLIVDCLLPGQVRKLGGQMTYLSPRRPTKTNASDCEIRGGEYVAYDRANYDTSLAVWLPEAQGGDPQAQTYVGEIYEKGLGRAPDFTQAAEWYQKAAEKKFTRAQMNLAYLYEQGLGVTKDPLRALNLYREASGITDDSLTYVSEVTAVRSEMQQTVDDLTVQLEQQNAEVEKLQTDLDRSQSELSVQRSALARAQGEGRALQTQVDDLRSQGPTDPARVAQLQQLERDLNDREKKIAQQEQSVASLEADAAARRAQLADQLSAAANKDDALRAQLAQATQEKSALQQQLADTQRRLIDTESQAARMRADVTSQRARVAADRAAMAQQPKSTVDADQRLKMQAEIDARERRLAEQQAQIDGLLARQREYTAELSRLRSQQQLQSNSAGQQQTELAKSQRQLAQSQQQVAELTVQLDAERARVATDRQQLAKQSTSSASDQAQRQQMQAALTERERKLAEQQKQIDALRSQQGGYNQEIARLRAQQRQAGTVQGQQQAEVASVRSDLASTRRQLQETEQRVADLTAQLDAERTRIATERQQMNRRAASATSAQQAEISRMRQALEAREADLAKQQTLITSLQTESQLYKQKIQDLQAVPVERFAMRGTGVAAPAAGVGLQASRVPKELRIGTYYALIIGNNKYQNLPNLQTAVSDALGVDEVLRQRYGFRTKVLLDATRADILQSLNDYRQSLKPEDSLLIYYAGHGELDKQNAQGYWLPVNAQRDNTVEWVSGQQITAQINLMTARHVMVVADSCYQGVMTRSNGIGFPGVAGDAAQIKRLTNLAKLPSRTVLTSGGEQPVLDTGGGAHSIFAQVLLRVLKSNDRVLEGGALYDAIFDDVRKSAARLKQEQSPRYDVLADAGHRNGEFLFIPLT